jgi:3-deoxy-manno-octulosonate cytidylyltransferase (CMP-KDO synthetase)
VYGFNLELMDIFGAGRPKAKLESIEDLEILRFIEHSIPVEILETTDFSLAVDYPEDIDKVEVALRLLGRND